MGRSAGLELESGQSHHSSSNQHICITQSNTASSSASSCVSGLREPHRGHDTPSTPLGVSSEEPSAPTNTVAILPHWWGKRQFVRHIINYWVAPRICGAQSTVQIKDGGLNNCMWKWSDLLYNANDLHNMLVCLLISHNKSREDQTKRLASHKDWKLGETSNNVSFIIFHHHFLFQCMYKYSNTSGFRLP